MKEETPIEEMEQTGAVRSGRVIYLDGEKTSVIASGLKAIMVETKYTEPWVATGADNILEMTENSSALVTISAEEKKDGERIGCTDHEAPGHNKIFLRLAEQLLLEDALLWVVRAAHRADPESARLAWELIEHIDRGDTLVCKGKER